MNYTKIPNAIIEAMPDMGMAELKITLALCRLTFGWHRQSYKITYSDMQEMTGLSRGSIASGTKEVKNRGFFANYKSHWIASDNNYKKRESDINYHEYIMSDEWKQKSDEAKKEAGNKCMVCNSGGQLDTHHRTYKRLGQETPQDLIVLCRDCHSIFHKNRKLSNVT